MIRANGRPTIDWDAEPDRDELVRVHGLLRTDFNEAVQGLERLADRGSVMSMAYLAQTYRAGVLCPPDWRKAELWYRRAANAGSVRALHRLGTLYYQQQEPERALREYQAASAKGYAPSTNRMAGMYFRGDGVARDGEKALALWRQATAGGSLYARRNLARVLLRGYYGASGVPCGLAVLLSILFRIPHILLLDASADEFQ